MKSKHSRHRDIELTMLRHGHDILGSEGMAQEQGFVQHGTVSTYDHSVNVCRNSLKIAKALRLSVDERALVRGALLHDYFLYDWHGPHPHGWRHSYLHAGIACDNAAKDFDLGVIERDCISKHMFPIGLKPPMTKEGRLVCIADKCSSAAETFKGAAPKVKKLISRKSDLNLRRRR